jgi:hypothetical protein
LSSAVRYMWSIAGEEAKSPFFAGSARWRGALMSTLLMGAVTHRTLDGKQISFSGGQDFSMPFTSVARVSIGNRLHEFTSGPLASGEEWARALGVPALTEEFSMHGGRLRIGEADVAYDGIRGADGGTVRQVERLLTAVWEGAGYSLFTHLYQARVQDALRVYDAVRIVEHTDGVVLEVKPGRGHPTEPAIVAKEVPSLGLLDVKPLTKRSAQDLPWWSGTALRNGELFRDALPNNEIYFVLVTTTAVVNVLPTKGAAIGEIPQRLQELDVRVSS